MLFANHLCPAENLLPQNGFTCPRKALTMTKAIGLFLLLAMCIQLIRPLGLPGLRKRGDCWKIAVAAFVIWTLVLLLRP